MKPILSPPASYDYIVDNVTYNYATFHILPLTSEAESDYVHNTSVATARSSMHFLPWLAP